MDKIDLENRHKVQQYCDLYEIPSYMVEGIYLYIFKHICPGSFLRFVLENNLFDAVCRADHININCLPNYVKFLMEVVNPDCYGSKELVNEWLSQKSS